VKQDAHEFFNFIINDMADVLLSAQKANKEPSSASKLREAKTWIHDIFEMLVTNETKCLCCETVSAMLCISLHAHCIN
jgi:ubiquitin carboxyl-terminal hydrolase 12/46